MSTTVADDQQSSSHVYGILWILAAGLCFVTVTSLVRWLGTSLPVSVASFVRYFFGFIILAPVMLRLIHYRPDARSLTLFGLRGLVHGLAVLLWFYAMARIPIAEVTAIGYTSPIFITIGAALLFGERLYLRRIGAIVAGLIGTLIILRPGFHEVGLGQLAQLGAAPLFALSYLGAKYLTRTEQPGIIVGMLTVSCTLVLAPAAIANWQTPTPAEAIGLFLTALFATTGHYCMTRAWRIAPISVTQPFTFLQLVWATLVGLILFGEPVDPYVIAGGTVIIASVSYIAHREALAQRRARMAAA